MGDEAQIAQVENPSDCAISILPKTGSSQGKARNYFSFETSRYHCLQGTAAVLVP